VLVLMAIAFSVGALAFLIQDLQESMAGRKTDPKDASPKGHHGVD